MNRFLTVATVCLTAGAVVLADAAPAAAQWRHGGHRGWHRGYRHWGGRWWGGPALYGYYGWGCRLRWRWDPYWGRYVRVRVCY